MITLCEKERCCGCSACYASCDYHAISMEQDAEGFLYPQINQKKCITCGKCSNSCPILFKKEETVYPQRAFLVQNKDPYIRRDSTSGGFFTAIAEAVTEQNGVVFGAAFGTDFYVRHEAVERKCDIEKFRNSKYVQSDMQDCYVQVKHFLRQGKLVLFSGTPCQVEGLLSYLGEKHENLYTVDLVCHAVPSPKVWENYLRYQKELGKQITKVQFRNKHYDYQYSTMSFWDKNRKEIYHRGIDRDKMLRAFFSNICDRKSCYHCSFKKRYRISDLTMWDCFEPAKFTKEKIDHRGTTRVLLHSSRAYRLLDKVSDKLRIIEIDPDRAVNQDANEMFESVAMNDSRDCFFRDLSNMNVSEFFNYYFPDNLRCHMEHAVRVAANRLHIWHVIKAIFLIIMNFMGIDYQKRNQRRL